jgi:hypothetical protein
VLIKDRSFWPWWLALNCTSRMSGFMGPDKPSSHVTTSSNCTPLLWGGLLEGEWGTRMTAGPGIAGSQDFTSGAGDRFRLSRDFTNDCRTWDPGGRAYDVLVRFLPLQGVYRFESPRHSRIWVTACPLLSSRSMSGVVSMVRGRGWLWLYYHDYCIYFAFDVDVGQLLFVYACSSL